MSNDKPVLIAGKELREQAKKNYAAKIHKLNKRRVNPFASDPALERERARLKTIEALQ